MTTCTIFLHPIHYVICFLNYEYQLRMSTGATVPHRTSSRYNPKASVSSYKVNTRGKTYLHTSYASQHIEEVRYRLSYYDLGRD